MQYVLAVGIVLIVADGIFSRDGFHNIRTGYRLIRYLIFPTSQRRAEILLHSCPLCKIVAFNG
jgi:hypothetical protein